jgi:hypothetical protein
MKVKIATKKTSNAEGEDLMRKTFFYLSMAAGIFAGCVSYESRAAGNLAPPAAPFKKEAATPEIEIFKPEMKNGRITSGNKALELGKDGVVKYYADGRIIGDIYLPMVIADKKTNALRQWIDTVNRKPEEFFDAKASGIFEKDGKRKYRQVIKYQGMTAECITSFDLLENGKAAISYEWTQFASEEIFIRPSGMSWNFTVPNAVARNSRFFIDGQNNEVPEKGSGVIFEKPGFKALELFSASPDKSIKIESTPSSSGFSVETSEQKTFFHVGAKRGGESTILLDINCGVTGKKSVHTYAGIDFKAIEDLEMPDFNATRNLVRNPSFEQGLNHFWLTFGSGYFMERDETPREMLPVWPIWREEVPFIVDENSSVHGARSLRMGTKKHPRGDPRWFLRTHPVPLNPGQYTFSFYAKGEANDAQRMKVYFPGTAWVGSQWSPMPGAAKTFDLAPGWNRYSFTFNVPQPLPISAIIGATSNSGASHVFIDGLQLETGDKVTDFAPPLAESLLLTSKADNFLSPSEPINAKLEISAKSEVAGTVRVSVKNFFGETLFDENFKFKCDKNGKTQIPVPFDGKFQKGVFVVKAEYELADGAKTFDFHRFSIMNSLENKHRLKNIFSDDYWGSQGRYDFFRLLDRWRKIGIGSINQVQTYDKIVWDTYREYGVEPMNTFMASYIRSEKDGKLMGFSIRDQLHGAGLKANDPFILVRDYHLDANGEPTEEYLEKFKAIVAQIVREHPWIPLWAFGGELFNKLPPSWWSKNGSLESGFTNFAKVGKAFYQGVKQGNPKAMVFQDDPANMATGGGIAETEHLLTEMNKLGGVKFDMIAINTYRKSPENPDLDADTQALFDMLGKQGYGDTSVFWPEGMHYGPYNISQWGMETAAWNSNDCWYYGPLSYDMGWTEKISAAWRARSWLVSLKYQDRIKTFTSGGFINNFEMDFNLTPFATQKISNTLGRLLGDAYFRKDIRFAPYMRCYVFEDAENRPVAAIWGYHPKLDAGIIDPPEAMANFNGSLDRIFDLMESERDFTLDKNGSLRFPISSFPLFFRGKPGTLEAFIKAFSNAKLLSGEGFSPLMASSKPVAPDKAMVSVKNFVSTPFEGILECSGQAIPLKVASAGTSKVEVRLPRTLRADQVEREPLPIVIKSPLSAFKSDVSFDGFLAMRTAKPIIIDGTLDDWANIPKVEFKNRAISREQGESIEDKDFSGWFKFAWDESGFYLAVNIIDDKFAHEEFKNPADGWNNDSLQIYFDTFADARSKDTQGYDENDYDYAVYPNADGKTSRVFRRLTPDPQLGLTQQAPRDNTFANDIPSAFKRTADGYVYEVFFPGKYLLPVTLKKGWASGFGLLVNDRDDAKTGAKVRSSLTLTPNGTGCHNKPHLWPTILLWE